MIIGIGTDIVEIERIKKAIEKNDRFLERIFSEKERELFESRKNNIFSIAANFAGKEAVSKVFGTGIRDFNWVEIEIFRDDLGKPYVVLSGRAKSISEAKSIENILISLSHSKEQAIAYAIGVNNKEE
ncbi:MAG: holo-ACP synthase [Clostridiales bacterium]|nr:holo-ACP synthase [Clostridiales bacterium]